MAGLMGKQERAEMMIARLQTHGSQSVNSLLQHESLRKIGPLGTAGGGYVANNRQSATAVRCLADRLRNTLLFEMDEQLRREASLHRREDVAILRANADNRSPGACDSHDAIEELFNGWLQFL